MRIKHKAVAFALMAVAGFGLVVAAQQKPAATATATAVSSVVVYKSPT
jgi:hypothetical protein